MWRTKGEWWGTKGSQGWERKNFLQTTFIYFFRTTIFFCCVTLANKNFGMGWSWGVARRGKTEEGTKFWKWSWGRVPLGVRRGKGWGVRSEEGEWHERHGSLILCLGCGSWEKRRGANGCWGEGRIIYFFFVFDRLQQFKN